jgi:hypothetical protein
MYKRIWMILTFLAIASLVVAACTPAEDAATPTPEAPVAPPADTPAPPPDTPAPPPEETPVADTGRNSSGDSRGNSDGNTY